MEKAKDLEKIISPIELLFFQKDYFEKKPLLIERNNTSYFQNLLTIDNISSYLERKDIRYPSIRLVKNGLELPQTEYLKNIPFGNQVFEGIIDNDRLFAQFNEGATIVFQALHRTLPALSSFCQNIEKYFKFSLQTNIYLTPSSSQGFATHFDNHDVFILQTYGSKIWRVYDSPVFLPTKPFDKTKWEPTKPQIEIELKEGDTLYIPRGFIHDALTTDNVSLHITLGLLTYTWIDVLRLLLEESNTIEDFRRSFNWHSISEIEIKNTISSLLNILVEQTSYEKIKTDFQNRFSRKSLTSDYRRLNDLLDLNQVNVHSFVKTRDEISFVIEKNSEDLILSFYDKKLKFPAYVEETISSILSLREFQVSHLQSNLTPDERVVLIKRLIKEGFLSIVNNAG